MSKPNRMLLGRETATLEEYPDEDDEGNWKRRQRFIPRCKDVPWKRCERHYLTILQERHNMIHKAKEFNINVENIVMIKGNDKKREIREIEIIQEMYREKDQVIQAVGVKTSNGYLERTIQLLYPLKLSCNNDGNINK